MSEERRHEMGPRGHCICPKCEEKVPHRRGIPCEEERCPKCGAKMLREGSHHHQLLQEKRGKREAD
jgi:predicted amidophosphoribosyltransferase